MALPDDMEMRALPAPASRGGRRRVLFICGSLNQTTQLHQVAKHLTDVDPSYTPYYADGMIGWLSRRGALDFTILGPGSRFRRMTDEYLRDHHLPVDEEGRTGPYDLVVTCSDLLVQANIRRLPIVLVQEGMTDPRNLAFHLVRRLGLPRWVASTSTTGLSRAYRKFCVASEGYRRHFASAGIPERLMVVTGIPNFDDCARYLHNDFPHRDYVLVATSDARETLKRDDREGFLARVGTIAAGRPLIFKLHPNENPERATAEIQARFPDALVFRDGNTNHMIANCRVLVTQYSSCVFVGLALGKECHSYFDLGELRRLLPNQNGGTSAARIAAVCRTVLGEVPATTVTAREASWQAVAS